MKKILVVTTGTNYGGIEKCLINFLKYLEMRECEVDLYCWWKKGPLFDEIPKFVHYHEGLTAGSVQDIFKTKNPIIFIKNIFVYFLYKCFWKIGKPWKAAKRIKKHYDIAIAYTHGSDTPYFVIDKTDAAHKYLWYHELQRVTYRPLKVDKKYFPKFDNIICVSDACKNNLSAVFPEIQEKFITLRNFYNVEEILQKSILEKNPFEDTNQVNLLSVGRLSEEKGIFLAIETCEELTKHMQNFTWYWVGDSGKRDEIKRVIEEKKLTNSFILLGNKKNPYPYMKGCTLYIQPSLSEAYCTTIIEALILKKGMVLTDVPSFLEQVTEGKEALIALKEPKELAQTIMEGLQYSFSFSDIEIYLNQTKPYNQLFFNELDE